MAIKEVSMPQRGQGPLGTLGQIAGIAAPIVGMFNPPAGAAMAAISAGGQMADAKQNQQIQQIGHIDTMSAMRRRQMSESPDQSISEAIAALDSMNLPDDQYRRYKTPLYQAMQKQGGMA